MNDMWIYQDKASCGFEKGFLGSFQRWGGAYVTAGGRRGVIYLRLLKERAPYGISVGRSSVH